MSLTGYQADPERSPGVGDWRWLEGRVSVASCSCTSRLPPILQVRTVSHGRHPFPQDHCHPYPRLNPIALQWSQWAKKALILQNLENNNRVLCLWDPNFCPIQLEFRCNQTDFWEAIGTQDLRYLKYCDMDSRGIKGTYLMSYCKSSGND